MTLYSSLTSFFKLDEASGTRADSVGATSLTDNNTVTSTTGLVYATAAQFVVANTEYLSAADSAALSMGDIDWWMAVWCQFTAHTATQSLVTKWDGATSKREYDLNLSTTRFVLSVSGDGTAVTAVNADSYGTPTNNLWHLVVAWHNSTANTINISVDGGPVDSTAHTTGTFDSTAEFRIGAAVSFSGSPNYFGGLIGPVMIGKGYIPTAADITYLFDSGTGITLAEMTADSGHQTINFRNLGDSVSPDINNSTDLTSYTNTSWTPPTTGLIIAIVHGARATIDTPTLSGNSLTWVQIGSVYTQGGNKSLTMFAADATGATAGVTTLAYAGQTETLGVCSFFHATGVDLSGGVAAAVVQIVSANGASGTTGTVTLAAAGNANNRAISAWFHGANEATTPRANWLEADDLLGSTPLRGVETQWRHDAFETTATATWATSAVWIGIAAELKATSSGAYTLTAAQGSYTLSGQAVTLKAARLLAVAQSTFSLTGQAVNLRLGHKLVLAHGSFTLSGQTVALLAARTLPIAQGSYSLTGQVVLLLRGYPLAIEAGTFELSGVDAALLRGYPLAIDAGSFTLTGQALALQVVRRMVAAHGLYALSGEVVNLVYTPVGAYVMSADAGFYMQIGQSANLLYGRIFGLENGSFTLTGQDIGRLFGYVVSAGVGSFTLTGQVVTLTIGYLLSAARGNYVLSGQAVAFVWSGAEPLVTPTERIFVILAENRVYAVEFENRTFVVQ